MALKTKFTETFGIEHPIAQGGEKRVLFFQLQNVLTAFVRGLGKFRAGWQRSVNSFHGGVRHSWRFGREA